MTGHLCKKCGAKLMSDEIALHMKLFSRAAKTFMCLDCQAEYLGVKRENLENVIEQYHKSGTCVLFAKYESKLSYLPLWQVQDLPCRGKYESTY